jgi:hypothetical protein
MLVPDFMDVNKLYPYELEMVVNGREVAGAVVVDKATSYNLKFIANVNTAYFFIANCHRTHRTPEIGGKGWGPWKKKSAYNYEFFPNIIEIEDVCPMEVSAFDASGVQHAFGYLIFKNPKFDLNATITCSGMNRGSTGVSLCNEAVGLEQQIKFSEPVVHVAQDGCTEMKDIGDNTFRYYMPQRKCIYGFMNKEKRVHRHIAIGFTDLTLVSEEKEDN